MLWRQGNKVVKADRSGIRSTEIDPYITVPYFRRVDAYSCCNPITVHDGDEIFVSVECAPEG